MYAVVTALGHHFTKAQGFLSISTGHKLFVGGSMGQAQHMESKRGMGHDQL
jgi:hypothetical protein